MITGYISRWQEEKYCFPKAFDRALMFLQNDILSLPKGKHEIEGDTMYAMVEHVTTEDVMVRPPEFHKQYVDIHVLIKGREKIFYNDAPLAVKPVEDFFAERDVAYYIFDSTLSSIVLAPMQYAIFLPWQVHTPRCAVQGGEQINKVVLKIHVDLLKE